MKAELRKEQWLEYHDRVTGGIPGLFPFVLDLPIRFTEAIDKKSRELGVFKHSRSWLRGWKLPLEEETRLQQIHDPEVVLHGRPTHLLIEVQTATKSMPTVDPSGNMTCRHVRVAGVVNQRLPSRSKSMPLTAERGEPPTEDSSMLELEALSTRTTSRFWTSMSPSS